VRLRISREGVEQVSRYLGFWPFASRLDLQCDGVACVCSSGVAHGFVDPEPVASLTVWFERGLKAETDPAAVSGRYELRVGTDVFTVDGTSGSVRARRGTADRPDAILSTDADTLHAVALGIRSIAGAAESGDLRLDGDPRAISGLTSLLQALTTPRGRRPSHS
jgi:hypothetical protein